MVPVPDRLLDYGISENVRRVYVKYYFRRLDEPALSFVSSCADCYLQFGITRLFNEKQSYSTLQLFAVYVCNSLSVEILGKCVQNLLYNIKFFYSITKLLKNTYYQEIGIRDESNRFLDSETNFSGHEHTKIVSQLTILSFFSICKIIKTITFFFLDTRSKYVQSFDSSGRKRNRKNGDRLSIRSISNKTINFPRTMEYRVNKNEHLR